MLVDKMTDIIRGKRSSLNLLDENGKPRVSREKKVGGRSPLVYSEHNSSRFHSNKKQLQDENDRLLKRLQDSKSTYNIEKWENDRHKQMDVINMRCKYNYVISQKDLRKNSASIYNTGVNEEGVRSVLNLPARNKIHRDDHLVQSA